MSERREMNALSDTRKQRGLVFSFVLELKTNAFLHMCPTTVKPCTPNLRYDGILNHYSA